MKIGSLNPYSNGRYSMRYLLMAQIIPGSVSLNPYSNGRYSMSYLMMHSLGQILPVLILILMEDTL